MEYQVVQYLQNLCDNIKLKILTLYKIELGKTIIPECLQLGDPFFTRMSVFGTITK